MTRQTFEQRLFAKIKIDPTDPDGCWVWTGGTNSKGYGRVWDGTFTDAGNPRLTLPYHATYEMYRGPIPAGMILDHICHTPRCVNPEHLRATTPKENQENRAGANKNSSSGVLGVHWQKHRGRWRVKVQHNGLTHHGGYFDSLDEAAEAARALRNRLFTHNNGDRTESE